MFEKRRQSLLPYPRFIVRVGLCILIAIGIILVVLLAGAAVYHACEHLSWLEAFLNAALVMTGIGLTVTLQTGVGKGFTIVYAFVANIAFFLVMGIIFAPLVHRAFHHFHLDLEK